MMVNILKRRLGQNRITARTLVTWVALMNGFYIAFLSFGLLATNSLGLGNALYMSIITFSTVGLGDFSPPFFNPGRPEWFKATTYLVMSVFLMLGLAMLTTLLSAVEMWMRKDVANMAANKLKMFKASTQKIGVAASNLLVTPSNLSPSSLASSSTLR